MMNRDGVLNCHDDPERREGEASASVRARELLSHAFRLFLATAREIFDEAAYDRYLRQTGSAPSSKSFAEFMSASNAKKERRPRCC